MVPFWHPGTSGPPRRTMGAAGWTRAGLEQDFHHFLIHFWDRILKSFWALRLEISIFVRVCFQVAFLSISEPECRRLGLLIPVFPIGAITKINFSQKSFFMDSGVDFCCFLEALSLGNSFSGFCCPENRLGNYGFSTDVTDPETGGR